MMRHGRVRAPGRRQSICVVMGAGCCCRPDLCAPMRVLQYVDPFRCHCRDVACVLFLLLGADLTVFICVAAALSAKRRSR